ncbi:MAG: acyl-CoA dehydrogenase family protein [Chloroflexi bacterium]|nr:acyl-CoA dehydrogenase family protein [Chloroflexota bacterium]
MEFTFTQEQQALRQELADFLDRELTPEFMATVDYRPEEGLFSKEFSRKMGQARWIGVKWPREYGGRGVGPVEGTMVTEELVSRRAPIGYHYISERQFAPSIMQVGTTEQKAFFLPRIARGEMGIAIGYSEPNAGSDLANLQTRATPDGDDYIINGQKVWTSGAHRLDYIWLATRTNPDVPKHKGLSVFLFPLDLPGVTIRPLYTMAGGRFNEVFFDNVRVPRTCMMGEKDQGWYVVAVNLDFERSGIERLAEVRPVFEGLLELARKVARDGQALANMPLVRHRLAQLEIEYQIGRWMCYRVAWLQSQGKSPNYESSMSKAFGSEWGQRVAQAGCQLLGLYAPLTRESRWAQVSGEVAQSALSTLSDTIRGGTSEVQRNIMAQRGLGLPR